MICSCNCSRIQISFIQPQVGSVTTKSNMLYFGGQSFHNLLVCTCQTLRPQQEVSVRWNVLPRFDLFEGFLFLAEEICIELDVSFLSKYYIWSEIFLHQLLPNLFILSLTSLQNCQLNKPQTSKINPFLQPVFWGKCIGACRYVINSSHHFFLWNACASKGKRLLCLIRHVCVLMV